MSSQELDAKAVMEHMADAFIPEKAQGVNAVVQYILTGDGGGDWFMTIADGTCQVAEGQAASPKATITMAATDYVALATGRLNPVQAFMTGKVKLAGDFALATKIASFFRMP